MASSVRGAFRSNGGPCGPTGDDLQIHHGAQPLGGPLRMDAVPASGQCCVTVQRRGGWDKHHHSVTAMCLSVHGRWTRPAVRRQTMNEPGPAGNSKNRLYKYLVNNGDRLRPLFSGTLSGVERLAKKAAEAVTLATLVRQELPEPIRPHVIGAVRRDDDVVVMVDSAAWSARSVCRPTAQGKAGGTRRAGEREGAGAGEGRGAEAGR